MTSATYEIKRDENDHRKVKHWVIIKDGIPLEWDGGSKGCPMHFATRRDAIEQVEKDKSHDAYIARLYEQEAAGFKEWNAAESKEIDDYAAVLLANAESWTFFGKFTAQVIARHQHQKDAEVLLSDSWVDPKRIHAEKRRIMAARAEAFKRAELEL
jgi:hypothetical protein